MRKITAAVTLAAALAAGSFVTLATASATEDHNDKVTICHAAGKAGTTKYVTLTISKHAVYKDQGGHFYENGTPQAGHEQDYLGACKTTTTTTKPKPPKPTTTTTAPPTTTTTAPPEKPDCTGNPATDPSGCPIDDCNLPHGNRPAECDEPELIPPVVIIVAPPAVPVPDDSPALAG